MSEAIQVGSQNQPNAPPPPRATQQTSWSPVSQPEPPQNASYPDEQNREDRGFFEQMGSAVGGGASYVVNGVEQFLNPEKTESLSLADMAAKGENATPWEKSQLEASGYKYTQTGTQQGNLIGYNRMYDYVGGKNKFGSGYGWVSIPIYENTPVYSWVKGNEVLPVATPKPTVWSILGSAGKNTIKSAYETGYIFGKNTLEPTLWNLGLYEPTKDAVFDLYNKSPIKYIPEPKLNATIDVSADTLKIAQGEGIPVTYADGTFSIAASGVDYDKYAARLNEIQLNLFNDKKTALENEFSIQKSKRDTSIFGTGLTWDEGINSSISLPKSWTPNKEVLDYVNSNQFGSLLLKGFTDAYGNWYNNKVAVAPANYITEKGVEIGLILVGGAAIKTGTTALRGSMVFGSDVLATGAEIAGENIAGKALSIGGRGLIVGSRAVQPVVDTVLVGQAVQDVASSESYAEGWGKVANLAIGGLAFGAGAKIAGKSKSIAAIDSYANPKAPSFTLRDAGYAIDTVADIQIKGIKEVTSGTKRMLADETASVTPQKMEYANPKAKEEIETFKVMGDMIVPESSTRINSVRLADDVVLTPEMERVLFGRPTEYSEAVPEIKTNMKPKTEEATEYRISSILAPEGMEISKFNNIEMQSLKTSSKATEIPKSGEISIGRWEIPNRGINVGDISKSIVPSVNKPIQNIQNTVKGITIDSIVPKIKQTEENTPKSIVSSISKPSQDIPNKAKEITIDSIVPKIKQTEEKKRPVPINIENIIQDAKITQIKPVITQNDITGKTETIDNIKPIPARSHSNVILPGPDLIFRSERFGKGNLKDEYKPKKFVTPGISGTMKKGYLINQFGSLEGFAKKAFSGNKVGFKKMKIK